jgi:hypothetical protein
VIENNEHGKLFAKEVEKMAASVYTSFSRDDQLDILSRVMGGGFSFLPEHSVENQPCCPCYDWFRFR